MESDVGFGMYSDDSEARSVAHEEFGKEPEENRADIFVLMIGRNRGLPHGGGRGSGRRKSNICLHHVRVEYLNDKPLKTVYEKTFRHKN